MQRPSKVAHLAGKLGVERRYAVRIRCPQTDCTILPSIFFENQPIRMHDISTGGCCLIDPNEILGPSVGQDVHFILKFADGLVSVHGRIVSRVDHKRHIQFLNLPQARAAELKTAIETGARAQSVKSSLESVDQGPALVAREIWTSVHGDSLIIEDHVHRLSQITIAGKLHILYKHAWPVKDVSTPLTAEELGQLTVFLCNIPQPTELLSALIAHVENMAPPPDSEGGR